MISFKSLGKSGRLGNQLFQYAFLRTTARRLGVKFYCPEWLGDKIFKLNDAEERASECAGIDKEYVPFNNCGFTLEALHIQDGTNIDGFFQSEKYFDRETVRRWYAFKEELFVSIEEKYACVDFAESTGIHLRFGDMKDNPKFMILPKE
jgi:hypothetical protein